LKSFARGRLRQPAVRAVIAIAVALRGLPPLSAQTVAPAKQAAPATQAATLSAQSASVEKALSAAFALKDSGAVIKSLVSAAAKTDNPPDRMAILAALADYEERNGSLADAATHFNDAAFADPRARDDGLLLDSARCLLASGDCPGADGLVRAVLLTCFDQSTLVRARSYSAWVQIASGDRTGALSLIRSYSASDAFAPYASALLFTLWWSDGDADARKKLVDAYPASPEAAIARGEARLSAAPFWFLMERPSELVARFAKEGAASLPAAQPVTVTSTIATAKPVTAPTVTASTAVAPAQSALPAAASASNSSPADTAPPSPAATGRWQQTGFFRVRGYADEQREKLKKAGFDAIIREEKRASGTTYYSVLVPETAGRAVGDRLKDAGFESYLVTD
jgi:hypothetical protein